MTKLQYLIRGSEDTPLAQFAHYVREELLPRVMSLAPHKLKLTLTDIPPPRWSVIPFSKRRIALVSIWSNAGAESATDADAAAADAAARYTVALTKNSRFDLWAYRVEESVPLAYERTWPDGEPTPGVGLLTLFHRRPDLDNATFMTRWHNGHTPLSLDLHPLWCYVRNVVQAPLLAPSEPFDGIVEEHFRSRRDLCNPAVFFGNPFTMLPNMLRVWRDVRGFIDLPRLESYLVREWHIRSDPLS